MAMRKYLVVFLLVICAVAAPSPLFAMHIAEGFLPAGWCVGWYCASLPFIIYGVYSIKKTVAQNPRSKLYMGIAGGFVFVLSALKLPSVSGSSSHLTGTGLGTILFGPAAMSVIGLIVLLFQALLLAHGGISTLGANVFSMAIAGPFAAWLVYRLLQQAKALEWVAVFCAAFVGDICTYLVTSLQLAVAYPDALGGVAVSFAKFAAMFAITQLPLAVVEGVITVYTVKLIKRIG